MRGAHIIIRAVAIFAIAASYHQLAAGQQQHHQLQQQSSIYSNKMLAASNKESSNNVRDIVVNHHLTNIAAGQTNARDIKTTTGYDYMKAVNQLLLDLRQQFITRSFKFDEHFRTLLSTSKRSLHNMFTNTYGVMYERNTGIFTEMYESLEQYYDNGQVNLTRSMDEFFANLYKRVFQVYNRNKDFPDKYLECVADKLTEMKPFKDVPDKLIKSIRYTFVAARTFLKSLNEGIDVIKNVISLGQSPQCSSLINDKLLKNQQSLVGNRQPPCLTYCEQVMTRCIGRDNLDQMNEKWRAYVTSLSELALKLSTSYNIETIIAPLDVQISEAIMNFQENAPNITERVYKTCGGPVSYNPIQSAVLRYPSNRLARRSANPVSMDHYGRRSQQQQHLVPQSRGAAVATTTTSIGEGRFKITGLDTLAHDQFVASDDLARAGGPRSPMMLVDEIKKFASSSKVFWSVLPNLVCTSVLGPNNTSVSSPFKKQTNCFAEPFSITDINSDIRYKSEILKQANYLEIVRARLDSALLGVDVDWSSQDPRYPVPSVNHGNRLSPTTTTTMAPSEPTVDDNEGSDDDSLESGSGGYDPDPEDPDEPETDPDIPDGTDDDESSPTTPSLETAATLSDPLDNDIGKQNDPAMPMHPDDLTLITPPNQPGFQRSSDTSHKLVIQFGSQILLILMMSVALLFVTNFTLRSKTISTT